MKKEVISKNPLLFGLFVSRPHLKWAVGAIFAVIFATIVDKSTVYVLQGLTNSIANKPININAVWMWALAWPLVEFAGENLWRVTGFTGMRWIGGMRATAYQVLYEHLSFHSKDYFSNRFAGALANKISNAVQGTEEIYAKLLWHFLALFIGLVTYAVLTALSSIPLALCIVVWSIIFLLINVWFAKKLQPSSYKFAESLSVLKGRIVDSLSNISIVHEYAHVKGEHEYIKRYVDKQYKAGLKNWELSEWVLVANGFLIFIFVTVMIVSSVYLFSQNLISVGVVVMIVAIIGDLSSHLFFLGQELRDCGKLFGQAKEGLDEILQDHIIKDAPQALDLNNIKGEISVEDIEFNYENSKVFKNFSLKIPSGQKVGLVGRSGAGKTTFVSLLLRHFDVHSGGIKIDGRDIRDIKLSSLRRAIGFVPQDTSLFHRTIEENIRYSNPSATNVEVEKAAKAALAHDFIKVLPYGYDTLVGERGVKLSGGQRQRVAIARAFLKDAPILILDEATSSLDSESEHSIQLSLGKLMKGRTVIAIAHRLSTLKQMDRIIMIEKGKIVEDGTPQSLLKKKNGLFKNMWDHQVEGFILDE